MLLISVTSQAQFNLTSSTGRAGNGFIGWGWNRSQYSMSDIHFWGDGYDFTLHDVQAHDRQTPYKTETYFGLRTITIPQTNFRVGYFLNDHWCVTLGYDHMKYVMTQYQTVAFTGSIQDPTYASYVYKDSITLVPQFLIFEHTDGLNYLNPEVEYHSGIAQWKFLRLNGLVGVGAGLMYPKTNVTLMGYPRNDAFHVAGWGVNAKAAFELLIGKHVFVRAEGKTGYIRMPDIITHRDDYSDRASQYFTFGARNVLIGANFCLNKKKYETSDETDVLIKR
ncbi:MAG: hypothetical protein ACKO6L_11040 [Flavobacteriales bacterium]